MQSIRRLDLADLADCMALAGDRDWDREEHKYRFLFEVGEAYGIDDPAGGLAGSVIGTRYGDVTAISMMLVARRHERQGLGGRLMRHVMERPGVRSAVLTATSYGRPLYERLGFRTLGLMTNHVGIYQPMAGKATGEPRTYRPEDHAAVVALDTEVFGVPRSELLSRLPGFCERFLVTEGPYGVTGFAGLWRNGAKSMVGPVTAPDPVTAQTLVAAILEDVSGTVRIDLPSSQPELMAWAEARGLTPVFTTTIMEYGVPLEGDPSRLYAPVMQALG